MVQGEKAAKKQAYFKKVQSLLDEYKQVLVVGVDNVGGAHLQKVRRSLRQFNAVVLMGKNTLMRKAIRDHVETNPKLEALLPLCIGNTGFVLTNGHLKEIMDILETERVAAPAKAGAISSVDVIIPAGNTGLEPTQTSFLQALNIATKISRGQIEILRDVHLLHIGEKVGNSEAALLDKLNIKPFTYGLSIGECYDDGTIIDSAVLKLTDDDLLAKFMRGVTNIATISLAIGYPTLAALPHAIINGYKRVVAVALATDYSFEQIAELKALLDDPEAMAKAAAAAKASGGGSGGGDAAAAAPAEEESEEESEEAVDFDLFG